MKRPRLVPFFRPTHFPGFGPFAALFYVYLYTPIIILVILSFNASSSATVWGGVSLKWYRIALANDGLRSAAVNSIVVAVSAATIATAVATMAAISISRRATSRSAGVVQGLIMLPLVIPEIVVGVAMLSFFAAIGVSLGRGNLVIAHTVLCIPYAFLPIRARLQNVDRALEEAARDLYATEWRLLRRITLPLLMPGIIAGLMLASVTSLDDFIVSMLVAQSGSTTLPIFIFGLMRMGVTPDVNAASTVILCISIVLVVLAFLVARQPRPVQINNRTEQKDE